MATSAQRATASHGTTSGSVEPAKNGEQTTVNRKKQKRREKQAAKIAASQGQPPALNGTTGTKTAQEVSSSQLESDTGYVDINGDRAEYSKDDAELFYSDEDPGYSEQAPPVSTASKSRRKKKKNRNDVLNSQYADVQMPGTFQPPPLPPQQPGNTISKQPRSNHKNSIWNTSTAEERERIKEFWIGLDEAERRSLVKVEKEAVLKKMKEQQKHSCSCSVCGRKRNAIEEELEVLYDAYYEELEQYANHRQLGIDGGNPMLPPPGSYSSMTRTPLRQDPRTLSSRLPPSQRMAGTFDDDELEEDDYSEDEDDEDDEEYEDDSYSSEMAHHPVASDIFTLGKNLTAQGGILTVADDLLKNDGRRFIEMMEQLAERRMQREEEAQYAARGLTHSLSGHNHQPIDDDEYDHDDDDDDYASDDDDDYEEEDEVGGLTEEQRMEEGRRMFQIFAARMFEQRVLTAYREKIARERQEKLLEELADESRLGEQREAKKARDAAKKKEKKNKQKAAKEEERLKREAEKAEQEAAEKAAEEQRLEEQRARKEAQRKKREAEKQAQDAEKQRKEAERLRKQQEVKDLQAEQERKQREHKEREKKRKDEVKRKEREEKEQREQEKRERDAAAKADLDAKEAREREAREKPKKEVSTRTTTQTATVPIPLARKSSSTVPIPPGFNNAGGSASSPHPQIATPSIPKAPTPMRPKQTSRQGSIQSSPKSSTYPASSSATSPSSTNIPQPHIVPQVASKPLQPQSQFPHIPTNIPPPAGPPPGMHHHPLGPLSGPPGISSPAFAPGFGPVPPPGLPSRIPIGHETANYQQPFGSPMYRGFANTPSTVSFPPGIGAVPRQTAPGRGSPGDTIVQTPIGTGVTPGPIQPTSHSRNASASFDPPPPIQPIGRPAAATRTSMSATRPDLGKQDMDGNSKQLGSSALLDDTDDASDPALDRSHMGSTLNRPARLGFGGNSIFPDALNSAKSDAFPRSGWGAPPIGFGTPTMSNAPHWPSATANHWPNSAFGHVNGPSRQPRAVTLRVLICQACRALSNHATDGNPPGFGYHPIESVMHHLEQSRPHIETVPQRQEVLDICETEGNLQNGGGILSIQEQRGRGLCVKWIPDVPAGGRPSSGAPGEIGSPIVGSAHPFGSSRPFPGLSNTGL